MTLENITLQVPDIRCGGCANNIRSILSRQPGIHTVEVDLGAKHVRIQYDPARATVAGVGKVLATAGYPVAALLQEPS